MGAAFATWFTNNRDVYVGNATAVRDYRVQLRGNRSVLLFGIYLMILIGVAVFIYSTSTSMYRTSIVDAQAHLREFYRMTMMLLGLTVCVVAPGLTATTIVLERQRQSIDLVFSAPVTPKYYLVGKMISSFRYTWMLLVLALPVTAASVVLGGAAWTDVLQAYMLLSLQGLMLTAFALLMSAVSPKPIGAIIWSYSAALLYGFAGYGIASSADYVLRSGHGAGSEAPFWIALSPFSAVNAARTYSVIGGHAIPNWIILGVVSLLVVKICLLGAGTLLSPSGGKEVVGLRLHSLIYTTAIAGIAGWALWPTILHSPRSFDSSGPSTQGGVVGLILTWCTAPILLFIPFISSFGFDREHRFRPNGVFAFRNILDGTPGGGLPFLLTTLAIVFGGFAVGGWLNSHVWVDSAFLIYAFFAASFWTLFWSIGRLASSFFGPLKTSRTLVFASFLLLAALPYPFLIAVAGVDSDGKGHGIWSLYILNSITTQSTDCNTQSVIVASVMLGLSALMTTASEIRVRKKLSTMRNYDAQPLPAAPYRLPSAF